jgi:hypothetical protein
LQIYHHPLIRKFIAFQSRTDLEEMINVEEKSRSLDSPDDFFVYETALSFGK